MSYAQSIGVFLTRLVTVLYRQPCFGKFLRLEEIKQNIIKAAKRKEEQFPELVFSYLSTAFLFPKIVFRYLRWDFILLLFSLASNISAPKSGLPLLKPSKQKNEKDVWDYEGRGYALYVHIIASAYGWTQDKINKLDTNVALALVQEIITDEQLDREFLWNMSDKSYTYNSKTQVGTPNPLTRPYFMQKEVEAPKKTRIPKSMLPQGYGINAPTESEIQTQVPNLTRGL